MKTAITALALSAACLIAHAEDLAPSIRTCQGFSDAGDFVTSLSAKKPTRITNGVRYYIPRRPVTYSGQAVLAIFAYGKGVDSRPDAFGYGVVIEGTPDYGRMLVKDSPAHAWPSAYTMSDHEFIEVGCSK